MTENFPIARFAADSLDLNALRRHLQEYPTGSLQDFSWGAKGRADYGAAEDWLTLAAMRAITSQRKMQLLAAALIAGGSLQFLTGSMATVVSADFESALPAAAKQSFATHRTRPAPTVPAGSARMLSALAHRTTDAAQAGALFAPHSWYSPPPPPPPPAPAPVAAPTAPPLPYTLMGSYTNSDNTTIYFVSRDDRVYDVKPGDVLDQTYSVAAVENGQLIFIYKPLNVRQSLPIGAAQ